MADQVAQARQFAELHKKGDPVIIYNAWDGGSAKTIMGCGAKAIATGDHPVGFAHGFGDEDFDQFTFDMYLGTIKDIARVVGEQLPFSVDINYADGLTGSDLEERIRILLELGVIGVNFEDRLPDGSGVQPVEEQCARISTIRQAADAAGVPLFINARTDMFALDDKSGHAGLLDEAISRAQAFAEAGASGFFTPGLGDIGLISQLTEKVSLPVNIIRLPGTPTTKELTAAGVSRVSFGPVPQLQMTEWLKDKAAAALRGED